MFLPPICGKTMLRKKSVYSKDREVEELKASLVRELIVCHCCGEERDSSSPELIKIRHASFNDIFHMVL